MLTSDEMLSLFADVLTQVDTWTVKTIKQTILVIIQGLRSEATTKALDVLSAVGLA